MRGHRIGIAVALLLIASSAAWAGTGGWVEFVDETADRLVADTSVGANDEDEKDYAWADLDNDGDIDLICVRKEPFTTPGRRRNVLFMNEGIAEGHAIDGVLVDRTVEYATNADDGGQGFLDLTNDRDVVIADFDGDGWLDFTTVTTISDGLPKTISHPRIYMNLGNDGNGDWLGFQYQEARIPQIYTIGSHIAVAPRFCSAAAGDVTGDGKPDLYFGDYDSSGVGGGSPENPANDVNDRLFINNGSGFFTDSLETRMTSQMLLSAFSMAAIMVDINQDGVMDVIKDTALNAPQRVSISYNNPGNEGFFDDFDIIAANASPYHINIGDLNNDDWLDLVVTDDGQDFYLLNQHNGGDGLANFTSFSFLRASGSDNQFGGNNLIVDVNNDGFNDVFIADNDVDITGCTRGSHLYRNLGNLPNVTLQEQGSAPPWTPDGVHDEAIFDINSDGWKDMVIGTCDTTQIWINQPPIDLIFSFPDGLPGTVTPEEETTFRVAVSATGSTPQPGTGKQYVSVNGGAFAEADMPEESANLYMVTLPAVGCTSDVRFYITAETVGAAIVPDPDGAPANAYQVVATFGGDVIVNEKFETGSFGWTIQNDPSVTTGAWERVDPVGTFFPDGSTTPAQPEDDFGAAAEEVTCYVTGQHTSGTAGTDDLDGGPTILTSPRLSLQDSDALVAFAWWQFSSVGGSSVPDALTAEITSDGLNWVQVAQTYSTNSEWQVVSFKVSDYVHPSAQVYVRFVSVDNPNNSITESAIDNFVVTKLLCSACPDSLVWSDLEPCLQGPSGGLAETGCKCFDDDDDDDFDLKDFAAIQMAIAPE